MWCCWQTGRCRFHRHQSAIFRIARLRRFEAVFRFTDPETGRRLGATATYLAMLFEWHRGEQAADPHGAAMFAPQLSYYEGHEADKWDRADLLRIDYLVLREALGIEKDRKYISPLDLSQATIRDPLDGRKTEFATWVTELDRNGLTAAAAVSTIALILADNCPAVLDPSFRPLQPVLRSNFWLVTHVLSITLSYAAFALALGIGNITLAFFLFRSKRRDVIRAQSRFTYRTLQVGVLLLTIGTILGGVWADYAWGRFWGWDPKEVWALIALLGYVAVLHARYVGWVGSRGLAALSIICFSLIVMAWYGVNFVLAAGLHSYGFGGGGGRYDYGTIVVQLLYVAAAIAASAGGKAVAHQEAALPSEKGDHDAIRPVSPQTDGISP